jgi:hypothetical protein
MTSIRPCGPLSTVESALGISQQLIFVWATLLFLLSNIDYRLGIHTNRGEIALPHPKNHVHQTNQRRNLYQGPDYTGERFTRIEAEDCHGDCNRQLKVIDGCCERECGRLCVVRPSLLLIQKLTMNITPK